jgi:hypothetical protein
VKRVRNSILWEWSFGALGIRRRVWHSFDNAGSGFDCREKWNFSKFLNEKVWK